jgi:hypothetical protein
MVSPINAAASVGVSGEVIKKNPTDNVPNSRDATHFETLEQTSPQSDESYGSPDIKRSDRKDADQSTMKKARGEVRKSEISNGTLTVKVYDSSGKLLRKIPPGYLPMGEQKFEITV